MKPLAASRIGQHAYSWFFLLLIVQQEADNRNSKEHQAAGFRHGIDL